MRYDWLVKSLQASLLAALGAGCQTEEQVPVRDGTTPDRGLDQGGAGDSRVADARVADATPPDAGPAGPCLNPEPVPAADGTLSGWVRCADGALNRAAITACPGPPPGDACPAGGSGLCTEDADCADGPHGRCVRVFLGGKQFADCGCVYGCQTESDCNENEICLCDTAAGSRCVRATCGTNADCAGGECGLSASDDGCGTTYAVDCRTADDTCRSNNDCPDGAWEACGPDWQSGAWSCQPQPACGRPLVVAGAPRLAPSADRSDWAATLTPRAVPEERRAALVAYWSQIAALEHASVASFSRFSLQLMALGAPPDLLAAAQQAAADEVVHAHLAYGLASAYARAPVGPGPLKLGDLGLETDPAAVVAALVDEACIGETLGAAEATAAAAACDDPVVAAVWLRIAEDERVHAELGWRTLKWLLATFPEARPAANAALDAATVDWMARARAMRPGQALPGLLSRADRAELHLATLTAVIPTARAALA